VSGPVFAYRRKLSWTLSILVSMMVIGWASAIASPFTGFNGQDAVGGVVALFVVAPFWFWSYKRGRFPIIRIGSPSRQEQAEFDAWRASHQEELADFDAWKAAQQEAELAEFHAWRAAKAAEGLSPATAEPKPSSPVPTDPF
jgi:hypothetical protein